MPWDPGLPLSLPQLVFQPPMPQLCALSPPLAPSSTHRLLWAASPRPMTPGALHALRRQAHPGSSPGPSLRLSHSAVPPGLAWPVRILCGCSTVTSQGLRPSPWGHRPRSQPHRPWQLCLQPLGLSLLAHPWSQLPHIPSPGPLPHPTPLPGGRQGQPAEAQQNAGHCPPAGESLQCPGGACVASLTGPQGAWATLGHPPLLHQPLRSRSGPPAGLWVTASARGGRPASVCSQARLPTLPLASPQGPPSPASQGPQPAQPGPSFKHPPSLQTGLRGVG